MKSITQIFNSVKDIHTKVIMFHMLTLQHTQSTR